MTPTVDSEDGASYSFYYYSATFFGIFLMHIIWRSKRGEAGRPVAQKQQELSNGAVLLLLVRWDHPPPPSTTSARARVQTSQIPGYQFDTLLTELSDAQ